MAASLEKLASYLDYCKMIDSVFASTVAHREEIKLLTCKGNYPYEYFDARSKLDETNLLHGIKFVVPGTQSRTAFVLMFFLYNSGSN